MKISFNWLRELVDLKPGVTADSVAEKLTLAGLEVEAIERRGRDRDAAWSSPRCAASARTRAPTSCRSSACAAGGAEEEVVCGAPNVPAPGGKVAWAQPGATLPGGRTLDRREIRGVMSPGMLCSEAELGLGEEGDGILILSPDDAGRRRSGAAGRPARRGPGGQRHAQPARRALARRDRARGGGAVRDDAGGCRRPTRSRRSRCRRGAASTSRSATPAACPRYAARIVTGLQVGPSPLRDARAPGRLRRARHLQPGRRHQLRDAGDRPPAARLRPRPAARRRSSSAGAPTAASR